MAKPENGSFWSELFSTGLYKRSQGRLARQLTAAGLGIIVVVGAYILSQGLLAGLATTYYKVVATVPGPQSGQPAGEVGDEATLRKLATEHGLSWTKASVQSGRRNIEFRIQTSRLWVTDENLQVDGKRKGQDFAASIKADPALHVISVKGPDPVTERARIATVGIPLLICAVFGWIIFRLVNYPRFAEFLISVEGEMNKVSWASKEELKRATIVVLSTMFFLAAVLFVYDWFLLHVLKLIGVVRY